MEILSIVLLVFGVLQIILFFRMWGMTNHVREIYGKMNADSYLSCILKGDKENAYRIAVDGLYKELADRAYDNPSLFPEKAAPVIEKYRKMIKETGHEVPELLSHPEKFMENHLRIGEMTK